MIYPKACLIIILSFSLSAAAFSQCMLKEVPLVDLVTNSDLVIEGQVLEHTSFIQQSTGNIYTDYKVDVYAILKGQLTDTVVDVIERGGIVGMQAEIATPSIQIQDGDHAVFYLQKDNAMRQEAYSPYAGVQGCMVLRDLHFSNAFQSYMYTNRFDLEHSSKPYDVGIYDRIKEISGQEAIVRKSILTDIVPPHPQTRDEQELSPIINSFSPGDITAGTQSVLTITGSGFGSTRGNGFVSFKSADNGGATFGDVHIAGYYVSWSDNQIKVRVPSTPDVVVAGTGTIKVTNNSGQSFTSNNQLFVRYARSELVDNGSLERQDLIDTNNVGGYSLHFSTAANSNQPFVDAYKRALQQWRCETLVNFSMSFPTSTNSQTRDGLCVIRFDIGNELPNGTLALTLTYLTGCGNGISEWWWVDEVDQSFDDATNWNYGPGNPAGNQYDFETVALHELGHAHMLNHTNNLSDVMFFSKSPGETDRTLIDSTDVACAQLVLSQSTSGVILCSPPHMIPIQQSSCSLIVSVPPDVLIENNINVYPNPASSLVVVQFSASLAGADVHLYDMLGNEMVVEQRKKSEHELELNMEALPSGEYFLEIAQKEKLQRLKVLKL